VIAIASGNLLCNGASNIYDHFLPLEDIADTFVFSVQKVRGESMNCEAP
jgi:hypothetical protein